MARLFSAAKNTRNKKRTIRIGKDNTIKKNKVQTSMTKKLNEKEISDSFKNKLRKVLSKVKRIKKFFFHTNLRKENTNLEEHSLRMIETDKFEIVSVGNMIQIHWRKRSNVHDN
jgi:hypothetical protein